MPVLSNVAAALPAHAIRHHEPLLVSEPIRATRDPRIAAAEDDTTAPWPPSLHTAAKCVPNPLPLMQVAPARCWLISVFATVDRHLPELRRQARRDGARRWARAQLLLRPSPCFQNFRGNSPRQAPAEAIPRRSLK